MYELTIEKLRCNQTADPKRDNCRIEVFLDGSNRREPYSLRKQMTSSGSDWTIDRTFWFDSSISLELYSEDWLFPDDWLGTGSAVNYPSVTDLGSGSPSGGGSITFQRNGADYELTYSQTQSSQSLKPVDKALQAFPTSSSVGQWAWIDAKPLKQSVKETVNFALGQTDPGKTGASIPGAPFSVWQGGTPFCGPAGIAFSLAARQPRRFVETVRSLYEQGEFLGSEQVGLVSQALRHSTVPDWVSDWNEWADWVILCSIRESAHWFNVANNWFLSPPEVFGVRLAILSVVHMNLPWTVALWAEDVLGHNKSTWLSSSDALNFIHGAFNITHHAPTKKQNGVEVLREAKKSYDKGGFATLLVSGEFPDSVDFWLANNPFQSFHWVALGGNVTISGSDVSLEYHDSRYQSTSPQSKTFTHGEFNDLVWGAVAGGG